MATEGESFYKVLDLQVGCSQEDIKNAYRVVILKNHPDKVMRKSPEEQKKAKEKFEAAKVAFETLSDETLRREYDAKLSAEEQRKKRQRETNAVIRKKQTDLEERERLADLDKRQKYSESHGSFGASVSEDSLGDLEAKRKRKRAQEEKEMEMMAEQERAQRLSSKTSASSSSSSATSSSSVNVDQKKEMAFEMVARWKTARGTYSVEKLTSLFGRWGPLAQIRILQASKKSQRALICFRVYESAVKAMFEVQEEGRILGDSFNPISLHWADPLRAPSVSSSRPASSFEYIPSFEELSALESRVLSKLVSPVHPVDLTSSS